jgi:hypothetical protein
MSAPLKTFSFPVLFLVLAVGCSSAQTHRQLRFGANSKVTPKQLPQDPLEREASSLVHLQCEFLAPAWDLFKCSDATNDLLLKHKGKRFLMRDLHDLYGRVDISNCERAVAFVRIRTSPATYAGFEKLRHEVMAREAMDAKAVFGDAGLANRLARFPFEGPFGLASRRTLKRANIPEASCTQVGSDFQVTRVLLVPASPGLRLVYVTEKVGKDGSYSVSEKPFKTDAAIPWDILDLNVAKRSPSSLSIKPTDLAPTQKGP